ncbi:IMP cyclohydrolase [Acidobacteriota bacterium]
MSKGLENISEKKYPGRVIILGCDMSGENTIVIYIVTGRSASSQARKIEKKNKTLWVIPTDREILESGNVDLLIYPAICFANGVAVSNGKQTTDIKKNLSLDFDEVNILDKALSKWEYEPDAPTYTPRISGCILPGKNAALNIIKRGSDETAIRNTYKISLVNGKGKMIATYEGKNEDPLPSFSGEPLDLGLHEKTAHDMAESVFEALSPQNKHDDYRVAVACAFIEDIQRAKFSLAIINRHERIGIYNGKNR